MKKIAFCIMLMAAGNHFVKAQNATESRVSFMNGDQPAFTANYNYPKSVVEKVLSERLSASGLHHKKSKKGFSSYPETIWTGVTEVKGDVYTKVSGAKKNAVVFILISKGYDNFISSATDPATAAKAKDFLNSLDKDIAAYQLKLTSAERQKELEKQQKKENKLRKELDAQINQTQKAQSALDEEKSK